MLANPYLVSLKKAIDKATSKNCWYNPWKREGDRADFRIVEGPLKEFAEYVREMVGIVSAGERDSVEECHRHLVEKYDSVE